MIMKIRIGASFLGVAVTGGSDGSGGRLPYGHVGWGT